MLFNFQVTIDNQLHKGQLEADRNAPVAQVRKLILAACSNLANRTLTASSLRLLFKGKQVRNTTR